MLKEDSSSSPLYKRTEEGVHSPPPIICDPVGGCLASRSGG